MAAQVRGAVLKKLFAGVVDVDDHPVSVDGDHDGRQNVQDQVGVDFVTTELSSQLQGVFAQRHLAHRRRQHVDLAASG